MSHHARCAIAFALIGLCLGTACGPRPSPVVRVDTVFENLPAVAPRWVPLDLPMKEMSLPAFLVGDQGQLSNGCWKPATVQEGQSDATLQWDQDKQANLDANLKAHLSKFLVDANLDAELMNGFTQSWKLKLDGIGNLQVDPANIRPNFTNSVCIIPELGWFKEKRFVVTRGIKANSVMITADAKATEAQRAQLDLAISKFDAEFHSGFQRDKSTNESLRIAASDAYVGAEGTSLIVSRCATKAAFEVASDAPVELCNDRYEMTVAAAPVGNRYTLTVTPRLGNSAQFDGEFGIQKGLPLSESELLFAMVRKTGDKVTVNNIEILLVGAGG